MSLLSSITGAITKALDDIKPTKKAESKQEAQSIFDDMKKSVSANDTNVADEKELKELQDAVDAELVELKDTEYNLWDGDPASLMGINDNNPVPTAPLPTE